MRKDLPQSTPRSQSNLNSAPLERSLTWQLSPVTGHFLRMSSVVFLRGINVGGANLCRPAALAKQLKKFDIVNIGAVGTFVVRKNVAQSTLRIAIAKKLPFKCEIMIVPAKAVVDLAKTNPFARQPGRTDITRFVNVLHKRPNKLPPLPLCLPSDKDWLLRIIAIRNQFVLGIYRRQMKAIGYLGKIEKILGAPGTVRNWNTIEKVVRILQNTE
jgi:uncharacterized protein (DUF1697 family)